MTKYLHTMIRVSDPDATIAFFDLIGVKEMRRFDNEQGRFTLIFLAAEGQEGVAEVELTYNWPAEDGSAPEDYTGGRNFGHLAYRVDDIYATCHVTAIWPSCARPTGSRWNCCRKAIYRRGSPGRAWKTPAPGRGVRAIGGGEALI